MRGLPGSGKSTEARRLVAEHPDNYKRINRDDLRMMFDNGETSASSEKFIRKMRDLLIVRTLEEGRNVIIDDTNLSETNEKRVRQLVAEYNKEHKEEVMVEIRQIDTPVEECIRRDAQCEKPVGAKVIRRMDQQFFKRHPEYAEQDDSLPKAVICDLDGTLCLLNGRNPFDASGCENDLPNMPVLRTLENYHTLGYAIVLVSGRMDDHKAATMRWLEKYKVKYDGLFMRKSKDNRKDAIVKREIFDEHIRGKFRVEFCLDDRDQVVNMWRNELMLPCFQVYYGDF